MIRIKMRYLCTLTLILFSLNVTAQGGNDEKGEPKNINEFSGAEIIIRLQKYVATDQQRLIQLGSRNGQLTWEIESLTRQFNKLDAEQQSESEPSKDLEQRWEFIRTALDLHLRSRQAVQQQINVIESKVAKQKEVINFITLGQLPSINDTTKNAEVERRDTLNEVQHRKVLEALNDLERVEQELQTSKHSLLLVEQLIKLNREDLELSNSLAEASSAKMELYNTQVTNVNNVKVSELKRRYKQDSTLIHALEERLENLENVLVPVVNSVNKLQNKAEAARAHLDFLRSPLAPHRISYWLRFNLPQIAIIIGILFLIWFLSRWIIKLILNRLMKGRLAQARAERLETLKVASSSIITIIIVFIGILVLLSEIGVDLTVVLGGAAVLSLVIAFGAQSLVKDYFSGFMILLENQYRVGNVVRINKTIGTVENMSLRLTVIRDLEGIAHFIPHGQITEVSNLTHGWSQIVFNIGVAYKENVDQVMQELMALAVQLKDDKEFGVFIVSEPEMLGVNEFAQSAIEIKFLIKTLPLKQWMIKREMLRRIKNRFDQLGIEIPFPHLTVFHRDTERKLDSL